MNTSMFAIPLPPPPPTYSTHDSRAILDDPFAAFGYTFFASSYSRHDRTSIIVPAEVLPPYTEFEAMPSPSYSLKEMVVTLVRFIYSCRPVFPPSWIGDVDIIKRIRRTESKWWNRCLLILPVFIILALGSAIAVLAATKA